MSETTSPIFEEADNCPFEFGTICMLANPNLYFTHGLVVGADGENVQILLVLSLEAGAERLGLSILNLPAGQLSFTGTSLPNEIIRAGIYRQANRNPNDHAAINAGNELLINFLPEQPSETFVNN